MTPHTRERSVRDLGDSESSQIALALHGKSASPTALAGAMPKQASTDVRPDL